MSGYVRIHRSLIGHPAFRNDAEAMAFAWMVCRAAWKPVRVRYKARPINLKRGQLAISVRDFANAMDRDKAWIERLLKRLKAETMIETVHETGVNVVTIRKYDEYQASEGERETVRETPRDTEARQGRDTEQGREEEKKEEDEATPHLRASPQPIDQAVAVWNTTAADAGWPTIRTVSPARRQALNARLRDEGLEGWTAAIIRARRSPYLGQAPPWFTFDWVTKQANFLKLTEGNYDGRANADRGGGGRMGGPLPDPTLAIVRAARAAQQPDGRDRGDARLALPSR